MGQRQADSARYEVSVVDLKRWTLPCGLVSSPGMFPRRSGPPTARRSLTASMNRRPGDTGEWRRQCRDATVAGWAEVAHKLVASTGKCLLYETVNLETRNDLWVASHGQANRRI